ncbi:MAG: formyltransferase [Betaproteobacteria bacterium]
MPAATAVVFAYSNVGARCLRVLRAHGVDVLLVVTHQDNPAETLWFDRVADVAADAGLRVTMHEDLNDPEFLARITALKPDFIFSFYYRKMLSPTILALASRGALNMHGSLLPDYRGRAPTNWAVLHGERETGATLHYMEAKPDAGDIVDQTAVPILPDDNAREVFDKVTVAAEITLNRAMPKLLDGTAPRVPMNLAAGSYFGARKPEDGRINWSQSAQQIHNLVRAVAPPYPGAFTTIAGKTARILRTHVMLTQAPDAMGSAKAPSIFVRDGKILAKCGGGGVLHILDLEIDGARVDPDAWGDAVYFPGVAR